MKMLTPPDFQSVFERLKPLYQDIPAARVTADTPGNYSLNSPYSPKWGKELFLGAVQIRKNYVSFHLMPVYMFPDLLEGISPALKKHMQGKSCFNFKKVDDALFAELAALVQRSLQRVRDSGLLE
jgi:hypothetical protein